MISNKLTKKSSSTQFPTKHWKLPRARRRDSWLYTPLPRRSLTLAIADRIDPDQIDEDTLTSKVSDEALEAAATGGSLQPLAVATTAYVTFHASCCSD
jgi:hypothetical protein